MNKSVKISILFLALTFSRARAVENQSALEQLGDATGADIVRFKKDARNLRRTVAQRTITPQLFEIALIGDSLSTNFYLMGSLGATISKARYVNQSQGNWFLDTDPSAGSIYSFAERLDREIPIRVRNHATVSAYVDHAMTVEVSATASGALGVLSLSEQVDEIVLAARRFPDITLMWIGHNNINWAKGSGRQGDAGAHLKWIVAAVVENYEKQLRRLVHRAAKKDGSSLIVVLGLINFESFFRARAAMEEQKNRDPKLYPYLEKGPEIFESLKPEYRQNMIRLALMVNEGLKRMVRGVSSLENVKIEYSDALARVEIADSSIYSEDAWHPGIAGHSRLAQAVYQDLKSKGLLEFMPRSRPSQSSWSCYGAQCRSTP